MIPDEWATDVRRRGLAPKSLALRIARPGDDTAGGRKHMPESTANVILALVGDAGVHGAAAKTYLVDLLRWHLGYTTAPTPTGNLKSPELAFIRRRAYELVDSARDRLPPIERDRAAT